MGSSGLRSLCCARCLVTAPTICAFCLRSQALAKLPLPRANVDLTGQLARLDPEPGLQNVSCGVDLVATEDFPILCRRLRRLPLRQLAVAVSPAFSAALTRRMPPEQAGSASARLWAAVSRRVVVNSAQLPLSSLAFALPRLQSLGHLAKVSALSKVVRGLARQAQSSLLPRQTPHAKLATLPSELCFAMAARSFPRISQVRAYVSESDDKQHVQGADCHDVADKHWINGNLPLDDELLPIANPMSVHPPYKRHRKSWGINAMGSMVVEVEAEDGTTGVGVTIGGEAGCYIVEHHLSRFIEGQDPRNVELMWDQMFRATVNYGRKGLPLQAISAVDLALWDLLGKLRHEPVYMLLGGATKPFLPMYTTTSRPDVGKQLGFVGCKVPCPFGPADGHEGFAKNVKYLKKCRQDVGEGFPLMLDCYMALSVPYSISLARRISEPDLHFTWMEEFLPPDCYDGYEDVMKAVGNLGLMLTTGEHEYTRWGFKQLIDSFVAKRIEPKDTADVADNAETLAASREAAQEACARLKCSPKDVLGVGASSVVVGVQLGRANAEQSLAAKFLVSGAATSTRCHEAQMLLAAESPHILRCHGLFEAELDQSPKMRGTFRVIMVSHKKKAKVESMNKFAFLLTDRCDCSLYSLAQATSFKESEASFAIHSALRGLEHLHALGMVHRDVKDANIMVQDAGRRVVLADFDLAAYLPKGAETTKWTCGTPGFLAPEVYSKAEAGAKADIFSLGVVLYYLLTQSHAFLRDSPLETEIATKSSRLPVDADLLRVFRSEDACSLVFWLLEPLVENRASASEALESEWFFFQDSGGLSRLLKQKLPRNSLLQRSDPDSSTCESSSMAVSKRASLPVPGAKHKKVKKAFLDPPASPEPRKAAHILQPDITWLGGITEAITTRIKSHTRLTDQYPWVEVVLRLLGACGTTILFGIRLVIAEFLFGIMAWAPVRAAGALLAAVPLVYTGRSNFQNLISCKSTAEALVEFSKLLGMSGPFIWFALRCLDWELGVRAMVGALSFNLLVLLVRLALSQKNSKAPEKEEKKKSSKKS
ncbi:rhmD [Symbiodinium microadriaticum]|nr:rhmD [Symbiodinium microadriaticum]